MAKPIKETPILTGKDASTFLRKMEDNKNRKVPVATLQSIRENAQKLRAIQKN